MRHRPLHIFHLGGDGRRGQTELGFPGGDLASVLCVVYLFLVLLFLFLLKGKVRGDIGNAVFI